MLGIFYCKRNDSVTSESIKLFTDTIDNARIFRDVEEKMLQDAAFRFQVHYQLAFILFLIGQKGEQTETYLKEIQRDFKCEKDKIIHNKFLSMEEKLTALLYSIMPAFTSKLAKSIIEKRKRRATIRTTKG